MGCAIKSLLKEFLEILSIPGVIDWKCVKFRDFNGIRISLKRSIWMSLIDWERRSYSWMYFFKFCTFSLKDVPGGKLVWEITPRLFRVLLIFSERFYQFKCSFKDLSLSPKDSQVSKWECVLRRTSHMKWSFLLLKSNPKVFQNLNLIIHLVILWI